MAFRIAFPPSGGKRRSPLPHHHRLALPQLRQQPRHRLQNSIVDIRLGKKAAACRQAAFLEDGVARREDEFDRGPALADMVGQFDAVHRARHLDVGEDEVDVGAGFEDADRLVGVARLIVGGL
jgi:hypothetical protein